MNGIRALGVERRKEDEWFYTQLAALNNEALIPYRELVPLRQPHSMALQWAPWGRTLWRFYRAWCLARVTGCLPWSIWGRGGNPRSLDSCPLCGTLGADLRHAVACCPGLSKYRTHIPVCCPDVLRWALAPTEDLESLRPRVLLVGLSCSALFHACCPAS